MAGNRGTDPSIERRQIEPRSEKRGVDRWLEDLFFGGGEVTLFGIPGLVALMTVEPNDPVKFAALVGWMGLSVAVGTVRGGWLPPVPAWIRKTRWTFLPLLVFHAGVLWLAGIGGMRAELAYGTRFASIAVATAIPVVAVLVVAWLGGVFEIRTGDR